MFGIWNPPTSSWARLQKIPTMERTPAMTSAAFFRRLGTKQMGRRDDAADDLDPEERGQRTAREHGDDVRTLAAREAFGQQIAREEVQVNADEGTE